MGEEKAGQTGAKPPQKNKKEKVPELVGVSHQSEEDQALKDNLANWVEAVKSDNLETKEDAVYKIFHQVISATSSMTSIPKPMKFLVPHYATLVQEYEKTPQSKTKVLLNELAIFLRFASPAVRHSGGTIRTAGLQVSQAGNRR